MITRHFYWLDESDIRACRHWGLNLRKDGRLHVTEMRRMARILRKYRKPDLAEWFAKAVRRARPARGGRK